MTNDLAHQYRDGRNLNARMKLHRQFTPPGEDIWDFVWSRYRFADTDRVCEVGAGTGAFWCHQAARMSRASLILTDLSVGMLAELQQNMSPSWQACFARATAEALPFASNSMTVGLAHFMLYHVVNKAAALRELRRVVSSPDGWIGVILNHPDATRRIFNLMLEVDGSLEIPASDAERFHTDAGFSLLQQHFDEIEQHQYRCEMAITDPALVAGYAQSSERVQVLGLTDSYWREYRRRVADEIERTGAFSVTKGSTIFVCR
jgi:SAM-dependent methyltransferase